MSGPHGDLRASLLGDYRFGQGAISSGGVYEDIRVAWPYYERNYWPHLQGIDRDSRILEIGCGHGSLLAWLRSRGLTNVRGVDASPGDVDFANGHLGPGIVELGDAVSHLRAHAGAYDVVVAKALLEHLPKAELLPVVRAMAAALSGSGAALIDVPNMDWLLAAHERYMDLTHEVGFTRESLAALLRLAFRECRIQGSEIARPTGSQRLFRAALLALLHRALYVLGEGANDTLFASRSLIAVARQPAA